MKKKEYLTESVNDVVTNTQRMTSLEIARLAGKPHNDVLKAIRAMEPAWTKVSQGNFSLSSRTVVQPNGGVREYPCYELTKTETLYIATKFNDEARAKLVLRWQELEMEEQKRRQKLYLPSPKEVMLLADEYIGQMLSELNASAEDTLTATQVAKTFNMGVHDFNAVLEDMGIQYRSHGRWNLSDELLGRDFARLRTYVSYTLKGEKRVRHYMTWTLAGLRYLNSKLGYPNF